jgi:hypothetical protein
MMVPLHPHQPYLTPFVQTVHISYGGKTVTAEMVDSCPGCGGNDLGKYRIVEYTSCIGLMGFLLTDMSEATFKSLAPLSVGVIQIEWYFASKK